MNTQVRLTSALVSMGISAQRIALVGVLFGLLNMQCVEINGGASELTWSIRTFEGDSVSCDDSNVDKIRLCWLATDQGSQTCLAEQSQDFGCKQLSGVTLFEIPVGPTEFFIEAICDDGLPAKANTYQTPDKIVRTVRDGEVVTLNSLLIVVTERDDSCGSECTCVRE